MSSIAVLGACGQKRPRLETWFAKVVRCDSQTEDFPELSTGDNSSSGSGSNEQELTVVWFYEPKDPRGKLPKNTERWQDLAMIKDALNHSVYLLGSVEHTIKRFSVQRKQNLANLFARPD